MERFLNIEASEVDWRVHWEVVAPQEATRTCCGNASLPSQVSQYIKCEFAPLLTFSCYFAAWPMHTDPWSGLGLLQCALVRWRKHWQRGSPTVLMRSSRMFL